MPDFNADVLAPNQSNQNALLNLTILPAQQATANANALTAASAATAAQQDLADRATLRAQADGFASADPAESARSRGVALSVPGVGGVTAASGADAMHTDQRAQMDHALQIAGNAAQAILLTPGGPDARAAAYTQYLPTLKQLGLNLPDQYPGDDAVARARDLSISAPARIDMLSKMPVYSPGGAPSNPFDARGDAGTQASGQSGGGIFKPGVPFVPRNLPPGVSPDEDAMTRTVVGEAGSQGTTGQQAVASVIQNRAKSAGVTPQAVVFAPNQFEPWNGGAARARLEALDPSSPEYQTALANVRAVTSGQAPDPTGGADHFYAPAAQASLGRPPPDWSVGQKPTVIGGHAFYKLGYGAAPAAGAGASVQVAGPAAPTGTATDGGGAGFAPLTPVPGAPTVDGPAAVSSPPPPRVLAPSDSAASAPPQPAPVLPPDWDNPDLLAARNAEVPNENPLLAVAAPTGAPAPAAPVNQLMPPQAAAAPPASPVPATPVSAPGAAPVAPSSPASAARPSGGQVLLRNPLTQFPVEFPGKPGYGIGPGGVPVRIEGIPEPSTVTAVGGQLVRTGNETGAEIGPRITIPDARRSLQSDENGMHTIYNADGKILSQTPLTEFKVSSNAYDRDAKEIAAVGDAGRAAQTDQIRVREMRDILDNIATGPGTVNKAAMDAWFQRWLPAELTNWQKQSANLQGPAAVEAFEKLGLKGAGAQERGVLGARGGFQAIKMFRDSNPGAGMLNASNNGILIMQAIGNQADADYAQAAQQHFATQEDRFSSAGRYTSLAHFDQQWQAQRNPQVYSAAIGAAAGQPASQWAKGLSPSEYQRALDVVSRADPGAVVNGQNGNRLSMQPNNGGAPSAAPTAAAAPPTPPPLGARVPGQSYPTPNGPHTWTGTGWLPTAVH